MILNPVSRSRSPHVSERIPVQTPAPYSYFGFRLQLQPPFGSLTSPLSQGCFQGSSTLCSGDDPTLDSILCFLASGLLSPPLFRPLLLLQPVPSPSAAPPPSRSCSFILPSPLRPLKLAQDAALSRDFCADLLHYSDPGAPFVFLFVVLTFIE